MVKRTLSLKRQFPDRWEESTFTKRLKLALGLLRSKDFEMYTPKVVARLLQVETDALASMNVTLTRRRKENRDLVTEKERTEVLEEYGVNVENGVVNAAIKLLNGQPRGLSPPWLVESVEKMFG